MQVVRSALAVAALLCLPLPAAADLAGFDFGVYGWRAGAQGGLDDRVNGREADVERDLGLDGDETSVVVWAALEHPLPVLPNLKLQYTPLSFDGRGTLSDSFSFDGRTFLASETVDSKVQLDQLDVILYYEVLDNTFNLDIGLNVKLLDGRVELVGLTSGERYQEDLPEAIPMLYINAGIELPGRLALGLEASGIGYGDHRFTDIKASLSWQLAMFEVEGGYRMQQLIVDDLDDVDVDLEVRGPYLGAALRF